jgi:hypothetical protein
MFLGYLAPYALLRQTFHSIYAEFRVLVAHLLGLFVRRRIKSGFCRFDALEGHYSNAWFGWLTIKGSGLASAHDVFAASVGNRFRCGRHVLPVKWLHVLYD